jgi:hypothetical protein
MLCTKKLSSLIRTWVLLTRWIDSGLISLHTSEELFLMEKGLIDALCSKQLSKDLWSVHGIKKLLDTSAKYYGGTTHYPIIGLLQSRFAICR